MRVECKDDFVYGYNLLKGHVNRDRKLMNMKHVAKTIVEIWGWAIQSQELPVIAKYVEIFYDNEKAADIALAEKHIEANMAKAIKTHLLSLRADSFLYPVDKDIASSAATDKDIIISDLKSVPSHVPLPLWKILKNHRLVVTPQERKVHLFSTSIRVEVPNNFFSQPILRCVKASLALDGNLAKLECVIVQGGGTSIDMLLSVESGGTRGEILLHEKWFDFTRAHKKSDCRDCTSTNAISRRSEKAPVPM